MKIFGIDPGSDRTGYGCVETDGSRHRIVVCGAIKTPASSTFPEKLLTIHSRLAALIDDCRPDCVAIENLFHSTNVRSALKLGHARGVAMLPQNYVKLTGTPANQMLKLMDVLDDHEDVKQVWSNFDIEEKEIEASLA